MNPEPIRTAVILAAGKGSRLHPITTARTKAMLPVLGRPIVARVLETLIGCGIREAILVVSPQDEDIVQYFEREAALGMRLRFVEQSDRLGMAHALMQAAPLLNGPFALSACDNLVSNDDCQRLFTAWERPPSPDAVLSLVRVPPEMTARSGIVRLDGERVTYIVEKPSPRTAPSNLASMPLYLFSARLLEFLPGISLSPRGEYELQDAIQHLIEAGGEVRGVEFASRLTLTTAADLLAINRHYLTSGNDQPQLAPQAVGPGTHLITPLHIESGTTIGPRSRIGPNVYIERDCAIGAEVRLRDAVVLRGAHIPDGARLRGKVIS